MSFMIRKNNRFFEGEEKVWMEKAASE